MKRINQKAMQRENDDRWPLDHSGRPADQPRNPAWPGDAPDQSMQALDADHNAAPSSLLPIPIDRTAHRLSIRSCNASRPRRFAVDPARRAWYARHRQHRFSSGLFGLGQR